MVEVSPTIQRITIKSWQYNFTPEWISERENKIAVALSRIMQLELQESDAERNILAVKMLNYTIIEERERSELLLEMENDAELQAFISNGWPDKRSRLARNLQSYWNYHDELTIESGILMKNYTILIPAIPATLRKKYLEKIYAGHQGINSCLKKSREFVFWVSHIQNIT